MSRYPSDRKVYVGDLGSNARKNELEYAFGSYGTLRSVWIARNPPGFAFVEFEDARDAADAVRGLDGRTVCGRRARVELSSGKFAASNRSERRTDRSRPGRSFSSDDKCYECGGRGHYARDCRRYGRNKRSHSRSRSRSHSRGHRFQSRTRSRSRSRSETSLKDARKSRETTTKSRQNGRKEENGDSSRYSDEHNGSGVSQSPKRRYNDSTPSPGCSPVTKRYRRSTSRRRDDGGGASPSRSRSNSHRE